MITKVDRIIITGSRKFKDKTLVHMTLDALVDAFGPITLVHGGCPTGADHHASTWAFNQPDVTEVIYRPEWKKYGNAAGPIRNAHMVTAGADLLIAFLQANARNAGTKNCITYARQAGIPIKTYTNGVPT